jgi:hypothetical protein
MSLQFEKGCFIRPGAALSVIKWIIAAFGFSYDVKISAITMSCTAGPALLSPCCFIIKSRHFPPGCVAFVDKDQNNEIIFHIKMDSHLRE